MRTTPPTGRSRRLKRLPPFAFPFRPNNRARYSPHVIALIDYGAGNLRSVFKALRHLGAKVRLVSEPTGLDECRAIVLPGVGAFDDCALALERQGLKEAIRARIQQDTWFVGICVGYQVLFDRSEEFNSQSTGLGVLQGRVTRFPHHTGLKVPQIGWNQVDYSRLDCPLFDGIPNHSHFYFVHSFYPEPEDLTVIAGKTDYGVTFASAIWKKRVFATQFHPEKSQSVGLQLLENFCKVAGIKVEPKA